MKALEVHLPTILNALQNSFPVSGYTHRYYNYPARFSPFFVRSIIETFSKPGDTIMDPFMGGGTTIIESIVSGRRAIGIDINPLSSFITKVKTTPLSTKQFQSIRDFFENLPLTINLHHQNDRHQDWIDYQRHIPWWLRKTLEMILDRIEEFDSEKEKQFSRMILLKTAQWALESQRFFPSKNRFLKHARIVSEDMISAMISFSSEISEVFNSNAYKAISKNVLLKNIHVRDISKSIIPKNWGSPKIILTSPPYWGVHILYHRWQVSGRRETPAPFWIANKLDGYEAGFYTFGNRKTNKTDLEYLQNTYDAFKAVKSIMNKETILVQLIGFANAEKQLPLYLETLAKVGLKEMKLNSETGVKSLLARDVPNRKWYTDSKLPGKEYLLLHKK